MNIKDKILTIRGKQTLIDRDLAELYEVSTKVLNQAVKRNKERFPEDFMFQLTKKEQNKLVTNCDRFNSLKHSTSQVQVFTEHGITALAGILRSAKAISVNIQIIRTFVAMRKLIASNESILGKVNANERKLIKHDKELTKIFELIESKEITPSEGIFFNGEIFEAYKFVCDLIKKAKKSIILIDNYVDENVLTLISKKKKNVKVSIYTKNNSKQLKLDIKKFSEQYENIALEKFEKSHDRFLIIDEEVYHIGTSLKDLGKKWFAFSKMELSKNKILNEME